MVDAADAVTVSEVKLANERMPKEICYLPALVVFALVYWLQSRRRRLAAA